MPKGQHIPNMMDNEVVELFYHCIKNMDINNVKWDEVARDVGLPSAAKAKERLKRIMKAQEKSTTMLGKRERTKAEVAEDAGTKKARKAPIAKKPKPEAMEESKPEGSNGDLGSKEDDRVTS